MKCECTEPGFCPRHNINKTPELYQLCKQNRDVFLKYEVDAGNISEPGIVEKAINYTVSKVKHVLVGSPKTSEHDAVKRMSICSACPLLVNGMCMECGCPMEEKVKLANEQCPLTPPKWLAISSGPGCKSCGQK